jgi:glycosyltransferase involved in cell wall biosynthesis
VAADIVKDAGMGVFMEPESESELADAVQRLADDPALAKQLGESGHDYITKHFDRDTLATQYLETLTALVAKEKESA